MRIALQTGVGLFVGLLVGCSTNPHKAEKIDTEMQSHGQVAGETVGTKDGNMIIQRKSLLVEELRRLQYDVYELEDKVYGNAKYGSRGLYGVLKDCRTQLADKDNGGDGKLKWIEPLERVTDKEEQFEIGLDEENKLVTIQEEFIKDRIARFREYKRVLTKRLTEYEDKVAVCKAELKSRKFDAKNKEGA